METLIMEKQCTICSEMKPVGEFYGQADGRRGKASRCKECHRIAVRRRLEDPGARLRDARIRRCCHLRRRYGITLDDYEAMLGKQGGVCAICGGTQKFRDINLAVDHCHDTGRIRGLLCDRCNKALGFVEDCPNLLASMAAYLKEV
jgi:hypothetical protein